MAPEVPAFTRSAVLQEVQHGDNTLRIVGYVDSIQGQQTVGQKRCLNLFKFVLTNGEKKMKIFIWEDQIPMYASLVKFHEIVEFVNIKAVAVDTRYHKIEPNFMDFDLSIQRSTKIICHGQLQNQDIPLQNMPEKIEIKYAAAYQGFKTVEGYLSVPFVRITTGQGTCSFASGAISDGAYKLRLQVANYIETAALVPGTHVTITGNMRRSENGESVFMQLEHVAEVKIIDDKTLSSEEIEDCYKKPLSELPAAALDAKATHSSLPAAAFDAKTTHSSLAVSSRTATNPRVGREAKPRPVKATRVHIESESEGI